MNRVYWIRSLFFCCMCIVLTAIAKEPVSNKENKVIGVAKSIKATASKRNKKAANNAVLVKEESIKSLDLSVPATNLSQNTAQENNKITNKLSATVDRFPQLLEIEPKDAKDFELGARLIQRDWKEVNEENKDWRNRFGGAEVEFKFRN